jgi:hypothetical protein
MNCEKGARRMPMSCQRVDAHQPMFLNFTEIDFAKNIEASRQRLNGITFAFKLARGLKVTGDV